MRWTWPLIFVAACGSSSPASEPPLERPTLAESTSTEPTPTAELRDPPSPVPAEPPAAVTDEPCPPFHLPVGSMSMGPSLVGGAYPSDLDAMLASLPERVGEWTRARSGTTPRGTAGAATPSATATLARGDVEVRIDVLDLIHRCRCAPGMGEVLRARVLANGAGEREARTLGGAPAVIFRREGAATVEAWVGDRCHVRIEGAASAEDLVEIASHVDWDRLRVPCAQRAP